MYLQGSRQCAQHTTELFSTYWCGNGVGIHGLPPSLVEHSFGERCVPGTFSPSLLQWGNKAHYSVAGVSIPVSVLNPEANAVEFRRDADICCHVHERCGGGVGNERSIGKWECSDLISLLWMFQKLQVPVLHCLLSNMYIPATMVDTVDMVDMGKNINL